MSDAKVEQFKQALMAGRCIRQTARETTRAGAPPP